MRKVKKGTKSKKLEVMKHSHPKWDLFLDLVASKVMPKDNVIVMFPGLTVSKAALEALGGFDIEKSMDYLRKKGGYTDVEVLLNLDRACG